MPREAYNTLHSTFRQKYGAPSRRGSQTHFYFIMMLEIIMFDSLYVDYWEGMGNAPLPEHIPEKNCLSSFYTLKAY